MNNEEYIRGFLHHLLPLQEELLEEEKRRGDICPSVGIEIGKLLYMLALINKSGRILEIGSSVGYGAIWLGLAAKENNGKVITIEMHERLAREARENIEKAGLSDVVTVYHGDAVKIFEELEGTFDLIFQDASSKTYATMLDVLIERLEDNGLLVADDVFFPIQEERRPNQKKFIDEFNKRIFNHPELISTIIPIGDGLAISYKKQKERKNND